MQPAKRKLDTLSKSPSYQAFEGQNVLVGKLDLNDLNELYLKTHGTTEREQVWKYLPYGPFKSQNEMKVFYEIEMEKANKLVFVIHDKKTNAVIGVTALEDINPGLASVEVGSVLYCIEYQKTKANTETLYHLLRYCIEQLGFRRIPWRCNNLNTPSKKAALRLGFEFEGIFYNHMIIDGANRDTAWFGLYSERWPLLSQNFRAWLYEGASSLTILNAKVPCISEIRLEEKTPNDECTLASKL